MKQFDHSLMFDIIVAKRYVCTDGRTASIFGAIPWSNEQEKSQWSVQDVGFTVQHKKTGTIGIGVKPWKTREDAENWLYGRGMRYSC